jgi:hypothetical protein
LVTRIGNEAKKTLFHFISGIFLKGELYILS